jgi:hypothetical protein
MARWISTCSSISIYVQHSPSPMQAFCSYFAIGLLTDESTLSQQQALSFGLTARTEDCAPSALLLLNSSVTS